MSESKKNEKSSESKDLVRDEVTADDLELTGKHLRKLLASYQIPVRKKDYSSLLLVGGATTSFLGVIIAFILVLSPSLVKKETIQAEISKAILNGADLRTVKQIYGNRKWETKVKQSKSEGYYQKETALSVILEDLRADIFLSGTPEKKKLLEPLDKIIDEHSQTNPFDKLETGQKDYFEYIRAKTQDSYSVIQNDLNKIADELHDKNTLVSKYLKDARTSFWISISALFFSFLFGFLNLYLNRSSRLAEKVASAMPITFTPVRGTSSSSSSSSKKTR